MAINKKIPVETGACQCVKAVSIQLPRLNPLVRIGLHRFIADVEAAPFYSRQFSVAMVECFREALRIEREERP